MSAQCRYYEPLPGPCAHAESREGTGRDPEQCDGALALPEVDNGGEHSEQDCEGNNGETRPIGGDQARMLRPLVFPIGISTSTADPIAASTTEFAISAPSVLKKLFALGSAPRINHPATASTIKLPARTAASCPRRTTVESVATATLPRIPNIKAG